MRNVIRSFAVLDVICLALLAPQLWAMASNISMFNQQKMVDKLGAGLTFIMFFLILIGAYGLFFRQKKGYILYYIQFPFRLYLWIFTLGFITVLPEIFNNSSDILAGVLLKICFAFEFIRLYITIRAQMNLGIL